MKGPCFHINTVKCENCMTDEELANSRKNYSYATTTAPKERSDTPMSNVHNYSEEIHQFVEFLWAAACDIRTSDDFETEEKYESARANTQLHFRQQLTALLQKVEIEAKREVLEQTRNKVFFLKANPSGQYVMACFVDAIKKLEDSTAALRNQTGEQS